MKSLPLFAAAALIAIAPALAQEKPVMLKDAPGRATVENTCAGCHSLDYIRINSPFLDRNGWTAEVNKMMMAYGAPISMDDAKTIVDYLAANYAAPTAAAAAR